MLLKPTDRTLRVNGIRFFHDKDFEITEEVMEILKGFQVEDKTQSFWISWDEGTLIIY